MALAASAEQDHAAPVHETRHRAAAGWQSLQPKLAIIVPTYNESLNVELLFNAISAALENFGPWEIIFVDDDSPDSTAERVTELARQHPHVRCIRRLGRRGLSSAVVEGFLATAAPFLAVIDADLQHDEKILPALLQKLETEQADIAVGSRYTSGGSIGEWSATRHRMSLFATWLGNKVTKATVTDPMSGFFVVRRDAFLPAARRLSANGYKILLDLLASSPRPLKVVEVPYSFRPRRHGESKVDSMVLMDYAALLLDKSTNGFIPPRFFFFAATGTLGLGVHMSALSMLLSHTDMTFLKAQPVATLIAMMFNFTVNNFMTYRDLRLKGPRFVRGLLLFCVICSIGNFANIGASSLIYNWKADWFIAGAAGALIGAVFNFAMANKYVWKSSR